MSRLRLAAGLALAALTGWWAGQAARQRPEPARTVFAVAGPLLGRLTPAQRCACGHLGAEHDPDIGCLAPTAWDAEGATATCPCRRLACRCPSAPPLTR